MKKVLYVEDDEDHYEARIAQLEEAGYQVCHARSLESVQRFLQKEVFDCVLLDNDIYFSDKEVEEGDFPLKYEDDGYGVFNILPAIYETGKIRIGHGDHYNVINDRPIKEENRGIPTLFISGRGRELAEKHSAFFGKNNVQVCGKNDDFIEPIHDILDSGDQSTGLSATMNAVSQTESSRAPNPGGGPPKPEPPSP